MRRGGGGCRVEEKVGVNGVAHPAQVVDGLASAARSVVLGIREPEEPGLTGHGLELLPDEEPVSEMRGHGRGERGDEAVVVVRTEDEVGARIQKKGAGLSRRCSSAAGRTGWR